VTQTDSLNLIIQQTFKTGSLTQKFRVSRMGLELGIMRLFALLPTNRQKMFVTILARPFINNGINTDGCLQHGVAKMKLKT